MSETWSDAWCPQCGPGVNIDEDGCCAQCGADAVGPGAEQASAALAALSEIGCQRFSPRNGNTCAANEFRINHPREKWCPVCRALTERAPTKGGE